MRRFLLAAALIALAACNTTSQPTKSTIVEVFADSCHGYATALRMAAAALNAHLLTDNQVAKVDKAQVVGDAICKGPQPSSMTDAVVAVLAATSDITQAAGSK